MGPESQPDSLAHMRQHMSKPDQVTREALMAHPHQVGAHLPVCALQLLGQDG